MKRTIMVGLALVIALILALILVVPVLLDMNRYRDRWVPLLEQALQRPVDVEDARLTLIPTLGVRLRGITVGDDPAFNASPFLTIPSTDVELQFWPLLSRRLEVEKIVVHEPIIRFIRNAEGVLNIATIGKSLSAQKTETKSSNSTESLNPLLGVFGVERLSLTGGTLRYEEINDGQSHSYQIDNLEVETNSVKVGQTASLDLEGMVMPLRQPLTMNGRFGPLQETLDVPMIEMEAGLGKVKVSAQGRLLSGNLELDVSVPHISTEDIPLKLSLTQPVTVKNIHTHLIADLMHGGQEDIFSRVKVGPLTLDVHSGESVMHVSGRAMPLGLQLVGEAPVFASKDFPFHLDIHQPFSLEHINLETVIQEARVDLLFLKAKGFKGHIEAQGKWHGTLPVPIVSTQGQFKDFAVEPIVGMIRPSSPGLTGTGELHWDVTGSVSPGARPVLTGPILLRIHDGELTGFNVVQALEEVLQLPGLLESNEATTFSLIEAKANLEERDVIVHQFTVDAADFSVKGRGKIGFDQAVTFQGNFGVSQPIGDRIIRRFPMSKVVRQNGQLALPFTLTGTLQDPQLRLDTQSLGNQLKKDVERRIEKVLQGDEQELQQLLKDGEDLLKNLFGQ